MREIRTSGSMRGSPRRSLAFAPLTPSRSPYSTQMPGYDALNDLLAAMYPNAYASALTAWVQANARVLPPKSCP
jgi:hypothetical protein